jgi:hypothetical protein
MVDAAVGSTNPLLDGLRIERRRRLRSSSSARRAI